MQRQLFTAIFWLCAAGSAAAADGINTVSSTLRSVMVFRSGAELTHTANARLEQGNNELIIDNVSTTLDPASISVRVSGAITVMAVSFTKDYLQPQPAPAGVERLQDSLDILAKESVRLDILTKSDQQLLELLHSNKNVGGAQTGVTAAELAKMMEYYRQQEVMIRTELAGYANRSARIRASSERLENQIDEVEKKNTKTSGRIRLQLLAPMAGNYEFTITYLTQAAHWEPAYDLKVTGSNDPLQLVYKARVEQGSGIDWKHVRLRLSTSLPSEGGNAPVLKAKFLRFAESVSILGFNNETAMKSLAGRAAGVSAQSSAYLNDAVVIRGEKTLGDPETTPLYFVDGSEISKDDFSAIDANSIGHVQVLKDADAVGIYGSRAAAGVILVTLKKGIGDYTNVNENQLDVVFDIDIPYDIPNNGKEQAVELKTYQLPCSYQFYAAPEADKAVYMLGQVQGWEKLNLLPGEASIMVEGTYIGKSFIDPGSTQDTLNLTLGRDKRIVVTEEKVTDYSSVKFLGSNRTETFTYRIMVRNNKKDSVRMLLKDQYPLTTDKDIVEELLDSSGAMVNKDTGVLTWATELAPGESRQFRISYSIRYPKDKAVNVN